MLAVLWLAALATIAAIRVFSPPYHGIDRRIDTYEWVDVLRWLAEVPLVASAVVTTVVWAVWRRGWWPYQLTLLAMSASVIYSAAMAPWSEGYRPVEFSGGDDPVATRWAFHWHPLLIWSIVEWEWNAGSPFVQFLPYVLVLIGAAIAPLAVRRLRRRRRGAGA